MKGFLSLDQHQLQQILVNIYLRVEETENINIMDLIEDIKQQFLEYKWVEEH